MRSRTLMTLMVVVVLLTMTSLSQAMQDPAAPGTVDDPIAQLRLMPEQRQRMRLILEETKNERQIANRRLREANAALDQALDAEPTDENLIEQRLKELTAAQTAQTRMRIQTELKIRRVLTPEQLATLRQLRLQIRDVMGAQRPVNQRPNTQGLRPNQRDSLAPPFPRRNVRRP